MFKMNFIIFLLLAFFISSLSFSEELNFNNRTQEEYEKAANSSGHRLDVDGGLGPVTIKGLQNLSVDRVRAYRVKYYADLVTRKPDLERFYFGWFRRALEV